MARADNNLAALAAETGHSGRPGAIITGVRQIRLAPRCRAWTRRPWTSTPDSVVVPAGGVIPILGARTADQLADSLACLDADLPPDALARLDQASHIARGFPHDFLASADFISGGMSGQLDRPPGRSRHG